MGRKQRIKKEENTDIKEAGKLAKAVQVDSDYANEEKMLKEAGVNMAIDLQSKIKQVKILKKLLSNRTKVFLKAQKKYIKLQGKSKSMLASIKNCHKNGEAAILKEKKSHRSKMKALQMTHQSNQTQVEIARRALALCEAGSKGSGRRAEARVAKRVARAEKKAAKKVNKKGKKKAAIKQMKAKIEAKEAKKVKKAEKKKVAKKVKKLEKKHVSAKCKACKKISAAERKVLGVNCKGC